ncbi:hemoglobin subunit alpha-like [Haemaphysalis longicornis]
MGNTQRRSSEDPCNALTERDRKIMRKTWHAFCSAKPNYGTLIFIELFQRHPTFLALFPAFENRPLKDIMDTPSFDLQTLPLESEVSSRWRTEAPLRRFRAHGSTVGATLSAIVGALDDPGVLTELIRKNVASHKRKPGVQPEHFERLLEVVLATMQRHCPALMTPQAVEAWTRLFYC